MELKPLVKVRQHRRTLDESMATVVEIERSHEALLVYVNKKLEGWTQVITPDRLEVVPYGGIDERIGWDTYLINIKDFGVFGFCDGAVA